MRAGAFIAMVTRLTPDRECQTCRKDGDEPNPGCKKHRPYDMQSDDAVETLNLLIREAREVEPQPDSVWPLPGFNPWDEHPNHLRDDWRHEVLNNSTHRSYWSWVRAEIERADLAAIPPTVVPWLIDAERYRRAETELAAIPPAAVPEPIASHVAIGMEALREAAFDTSTVWGALKVIRARRHTNNCDRDDTQHCTHNPCLCWCHDVIHYKDGNPSNNEVSNLEIVTLGQNVAKPASCPRCGATRITDYGSHFYSCECGWDSIMQPLAVPNV